MPHELRRLFAIILCYCAPTECEKSMGHILFDPMSEDFKRKPGTTSEQQLVKTLKSTSFFLESMGKNIKAYDLPKITMDMDNVLDDLPREARDEMSIAIPKITKVCFGYCCGNRFVGWKTSAFPHRAKSSSGSVYCSVYEQSGKL